MPKSRRRFTREFKLQVINEVSNGKSLAQTARDYNLSESMICKWRKQFKESPQYDVGQGAQQFYSDESNALTYDTKIAELERLVGRLTIENELLKKALNQVRINR